MKRLTGLAFIVSIFLSAFLLFLIQPIIGRVLLTLYGGSPAVWNTCMVCFQGMLLAGYAYAHWSLDALGPRRQIILHLALLGVSVLVLPFTLPVLTIPSASPVLSIMTALLLTVGLPFSLLASNSSLVQRWYSLSQTGDPFALYAVSNAGSLLSLLGYPLLFEPAFGLSRGWRVWTGLYLLFLAISAICMTLVFRSSRARKNAWHSEQKSSAAEPGTDWRQRMGWALRAAVASSLLLSVTMKITTDIASAPIFWVVPLSLYLLTFIIAFSPMVRIPRWIVATFTAFGIAWSLTGYFYTIPFPLWLELSAFLSVVFFGSLLCHSDLADSRPSPRHLTEFYLWISIGGVVGGIFNSLLAPVVFDSVIEFPITLLLLAFLIHAKGGYLRHFTAERMKNLATYMPPITVVITLCVTAILVILQRRGGSITGDPESLASGILIIVPLAIILLGLMMARHAGQFEFVVVCLMIYAMSNVQQLEPLIAQERSFFGVIRVFETPRERVFVHGTTRHGAQWRDPEKAMTLTGYYHPAGPFGEDLPSREADAHIGILGLGAGSLAAMGEPGQTVTFFEIDPDVETVARRHFTYLRDARARVLVEIGDGRLLIEKTPDQTFDLLLLDAFSSDAIPTHLLTREALNLYLRKVKPDGLVMSHISNRYVDMTRVFRAWAEAEQRAVVLYVYQPTAAEAAAGASPSTAVAIAPDRATLETMVAGGRWKWLPPGRSVAWTDDRIDLISTFGKVRDQ